MLFHCSPAIRVLQYVQTEPAKRHITQQFLKRMNRIAAKGSLLPVKLNQPA
jgi:hypothetical protein